MVDDGLQVWAAQFAGAAILDGRLIVHAAKKLFHAQKLLAISAVKDLGIWSVQVVIARCRNDFAFCSCLGIGSLAGARLGAFNCASSSA